MVRSRIGSPSVGATDGFTATLPPADDAVDGCGSASAGSASAGSASAGSASAGSASAGSASAGRASAGGELRTRDQVEPKAARGPQNAPEPQNALEPELRWLDAVAELGADAFDFVLEIVTSLLDGTARSLALGCLIAIGGCGPGERVEIEGVVRDARTGTPIGGAWISTDDGQRAETDEAGRFSVDIEGSGDRRIRARAPGHCPSATRTDARSAHPTPLTLELVERLEVDAPRAVVGLDTDVRLEVRARCDADVTLAWAQIAGPDLGERGMRVEGNGRVLVVHTPSRGALVHLGFEVSGELGGREERRTVRVLAGPSGRARMPIGVDGDGTALGGLVSRRASRRVEHQQRNLPARSYAPAFQKASGRGSRIANLDERCARCHGGGLEPDMPRAMTDAGIRDEASRASSLPSQPFHSHNTANIAVGACARCHGVDPDERDAALVSPEVAEWRLASMSRLSGALDEDAPALREECAGCHSTPGFVARQRDLRISVDRNAVAPITCSACHGAHDDARPSALRVYDTSDPIAGVAIEHLGSGALCASCHRADAVRAGDAAAAPHAPQTNLLVGRGARLTASLDAGAHRHIADTCVRCHMGRPTATGELPARAGGHTFSVRSQAGDGGTRAACAPCHGDTDPGQRDWDGDGVAGTLDDEHDRALARASDLLTARIAAARVVDECGRRAADVVEHDARLHLVDGRGALLGDCDANGRLTRGETGRTITSLPPPLADAAWDLALLRADGSRGVHNPRYTFRVLQGLERALGSPE